MTPLKDCILIKDFRIAAFFSGWDVWIIPIIYLDSVNENTRKYRTRMFRNKAYVSDHWSVQDSEIIGANSETCYIAIEPNGKIGKV